MKRFHVSVFCCASVVVSGLGSSGCIFAKPAEAPEGLEDLTRFILDRFEIKEDTDVEVQDAELREAFINLNAELEKQAVSEEKPFKNVLDDLEDKHDVAADLESLTAKILDFSKDAGQIFRFKGPMMSYEIDNRMLIE